MELLGRLVFDQMVMSTHILGLLKLFGKVTSGGRNGGLFQKVT